MNGLEQAAAAFETAITGGTSSEKGGEKSSAPTESMFDNLGMLEVDEESPAKGGGDDDEPVTKTKKAKAEVVETEEDGDDDAEDGDDAPDDDADADAEAGDEDEKDADEDEGDERLSDVYEVTVEGQRAEVTLKEALEGYVRTETFHRRLNYLNDVKQEMAAEAQQLLADRQKYIDGLNTLQTYIEKVIPAEPNWEEEYARDPKAAAAFQKRYNAIKEELKGIEAEKSRVLKEEEEQNNKSTQDYVKQENSKILANNPTWKDEKVMKRDVDSMAETAFKAGFTEEEVRSIKDSRMVTILLKAAKYDRIKASAPKPVRRGNKPTKPGAGSTRTAPSGNKAMKQLSRTGSIDAAAAVFDGIINPRRK